MDRLSANKFEKLLYDKAMELKGFYRVDIWNKGNLKRLYGTIYYLENSKQRYFNCGFIDLANNIYVPYQKGASVYDLCNKKFITNFSQLSNELKNKIIELSNDRNKSINSTCIDFKNIINVTDYIPVQSEDKTLKILKDNLNIIQAKICTNIKSNFDFSIRQLIKTKKTSNEIKYIENIIGKFNEFYNLLKGKFTIDNKEFETFSFTNINDLFYLIYDKLEKTLNVPLDFKIMYRNCIINSLKAINTRIC